MAATSQACRAGTLQAVLLRWLLLSALTRFQRDRLNHEEKQLSVAVIQAPAAEHAAVSVC